MPERKDGLPLLRYSMADGTRLLNQEQTEAIRRLHFLMVVVAIPFAIPLTYTALIWFTENGSAFPFLISLAISLLGSIPIDLAFRRRRLAIIQAAHLSTDPADRPTFESMGADFHQITRHTWRDTPKPFLWRLLHRLAGKLARVFKSPS
ncbi:hypothetical protein ACHMW4_17610 [Mesorhizobium sp. UC22_110]|uniref:hypothetical protein n=1 Tax=unclassified Mesorhizobium TaxID=325217 RepID=UPI003670364D